MTKHIACIACLFFSFFGKAQTNAVPLQKTSNLASFDIQMPVGVFARSHFIGAGLNYSWSHYRYGRNLHSKKLLGLTCNAGADYYLGKKIKPAGYDFRYDNYLYLYAMAGIIANPYPAVNISFTAGPALGIYTGNPTVGFIANIAAMYYLQQNIAIGPGISCKNQANTHALWNGLLKFSYSF